MHRGNLFSERSKQLSVDIGSGFSKDILGRCEEDRSELAIDQVPNFADFSFESVQFIAQQVVHEELTMEIWQHYPEAKPYLNRGRWQKEKYPLYDPEQL